MTNNKPVSAFRENPVNNPQNAQQGVEDAATWAVLMQSSPNKAQRQQFIRWLSASPTHQSAYQRAHQAWQLSALLAGDPELNTPVPAAPWYRRHRPQLAAACLLFASAIALHSPLQQWWVNSSADHYTASGEVRHLQLDDGSEITLGGNSAIRVDYSSQERRVQLLRGEALFAPAPRQGREERAFVVDANGVRNRALGTRYMVRNQGDSGWVGVLEHQIDVQASNSNQPPLQLGEGQSANFNAAVITHSELDPELEAGWSRGVLVFRDQPLAVVVERLQQYGAPRTLLLGNHKEARVSAVFQLGNIQQALPNLSRELSLRSITMPGVVVVY